MAGFMGSMSLWPSRAAAIILGMSSRSTEKRARRRPLAASATRRALRVVIVILPGPDAGDVFGPLDILRYATSFAKEQGAARPEGYAIEVVSAGKTGKLVDQNGLRLSSERTFRNVRGPIDTLLFTPIDEAAIDRDHRDLIAWIRRMAPRSRRIVALCTSAFLLAAAGLLSGRRATTHWAFCEKLERRFPDIDVDPDPIFVRDGNLYTSAGAMAGMDLVLALVEEDLGADVARTVARFLVLFLRRPGGQSQFSVQLSHAWAENEPIRDLQGWIFDHLQEDLSVDALASRVAMSPRNFRRVFARQVGTTPARFVELARVESARRHLEGTNEPVDRIASVCGFGSAERMRCAFVRTLGVSPAAYRNRFSSAHRPPRTEIETDMF